MLEGGENELLAERRFLPHRVLQMNEPLVLRSAQKICCGPGALLHVSLGCVILLVSGLLVKLLLLKPKSS